MKILLVYPHYPATFWSFRYAMKFIDRKASFPPLGLLTVAAMLPDGWDQRLVDMNVNPLSDEDLCWADYVFLSAMSIQRQSAQVVLERCRRLGVKTVAGGPLFTACHEEFPTVDHLVLGEGEITLPLFLADLERGSPRRLYRAESGKWQNENRDLLASVKIIQQGGLQVHGGFIVGFDSDPASIFERQIRFIQESGIVTAMVGILSAMRGTKLFQRLEREGRLLKESSGDNTAIDLNFVPRMAPEALIAGYQKILDSIYAPKQYYRRVINLFREYRPRPKGHFHLQQGHIGALFKSMLLRGVIGRERLHFWKLFFWSLLRKPRLFPLAITYAVYGYHFRKVAEQIGASGAFDGSAPWEGKDHHA